MLSNDICDIKCNTIDVNKTTNNSNSNGLAHAINTAHQIYIIQQMSVHS